MEILEYSDSYFCYGTFGKYYYERTLIKENNLDIRILVGRQNLADLVKLIPNVVDFKLRFCDGDEIYDLQPLVALRQLKNLIILACSEDTMRPVLSNINELRSLKLSSLNIYKHYLDPLDPAIIWPKVKAVQFDHIGWISTKGNVITYSLDISNQYNEFYHFSDDYDYGNNILVQAIGAKNFQLIITQDNDMFVEDLSKKKFLSFIYGKKIEDLKLKYPKNEEELYA